MPDVGAPFSARLLNGQTGDCLLYVDCVGRGRGLCFDLGRAEGLSPGEALRVTDAFVSHTHIDHFIGFDTLLRWHLGHRTRLRVHGPPGFCDAVEGRLRGYAWNLVEGEPFVCEAREVDGDGRPARVRVFAGARGFRPDPDVPGAGDALLDADGLRVTAAVCDHGIPCAAYRLEAAARMRVDPDALGALGLGPGPWVPALKAAALRGAPTDTPIATPAGPRPLGDLAVALRPVPAVALGYVADVAWHDANLRRLLPLLRGVDDCFCEGGFLARDEARARETRHLTARDAGRLARRAGAARLHTFHFSPRYHPDFGALDAEAAAAFRGEGE